MDKKIIIALFILLIFLMGLLLIGRASYHPIGEENLFGKQEARQIAENWIIENSPTYTFDGFNLKLERQEEFLEGTLYSFVFSFDSKSAGYGDRSEEMTAQVITPHIMEVVVAEGKVISAITDRIYDEFKEKMIGEELAILLYFVKVIDGQESIESVQRKIPYTVAIGQAAIEELLKGPFPSEKAEGFSTAINEGTELQSINIQNDVAFVDFNERLEEGIAGSAWVMAIRSQIENTLLQFDTVNEVVISINGRTEDILQP